MTHPHSPTPQVPPTRNWIPAITYLTLLIILLVINMKMIAPYVLSLLMGGVLALLLLPYYHKLRDVGVRPVLASSIITLGFTLVIVVPLTLFGIVATNQANNIAKRIVASDSYSLDSLTQKVSNLKIVQPFVDDDEDLRQEIVLTLRQAIERSTTIILGLIKNIPDSLLLLGLTILSLFFFLIDGRRFISFTFDKVQLDKDVRENLQTSFKNTSIAVIWASAAAALAQAAVMLISFALLGVPGSFLAAGATFIFSWIPVIGSFPTWMAGAIYLLINDRPSAMILMLVAGIFTSLIDNYIRPWVLKGRQELHPLVSLVAIFGGINTFGVLGIIFGPVFAALLISLLQIWPTIAKRVGFKWIGTPKPH